MTKYLPYVIDYKGFYTNQKCFILTSSEGMLVQLVGLLNSKLMSYYIKTTFPELQGGTRELNKDRFELIPICSALLECNSLAEKTKRVIDLVNSNPDIENLTMIPGYQDNIEGIDQIVYKLYSLTSDEIAIIESNGLE